MPVYKVKEIYYTLQGEGYHTGRPAVFCRFTGCNLWTGLEKDRENAICNFCDTDFWGMDGSFGGKYTAAELAQACLTLWPENMQDPFIVCTGGEPLLQLDLTLINAFHALGFYIAVETNGTIAAPEGIDWICMSPKPNTKILLTKGDELKFIFPQKELDPEAFVDLSFDHFYIQPMDNTSLNENIEASIKYCQSNPKWKLSLQTHKLIGIR